MITQITDAMVGKKVTCKIYQTEITDARIQKQADVYYICQNSQEGSSCGSDKLGYSYSWCVNKGSLKIMNHNNLYDLELVEKALPIFN